LTEEPITRFSFRKSERLSRKKHIKELFDKGSSFFLYPFKVFYLENTVDQDPSNQILLSVPKKNHRKAVHRNRIKRLIREAYRLNKHILSSSSDKRYFIAYIYVGREIAEYNDIKSKLKKVLLRLKSISQDDNSLNSESKNKK